MAKDLVRTRRYISKFYGMRTQLQAVSLRLQTLRSNQQMAEAMKGATRVSFVWVFELDLSFDFPFQSFRMEIADSWLTYIYDNANRARKHRQ